MNFINFLRECVHQPYFGFVLSGLVCACFYFLKGKNTSFKKIIWAIYFSLFALALFIFVGSAVNRLNHYQVFDFTAFYLYGKVAASGQDYYLPANLHAVFNTLSLPAFDHSEFQKEIANVGFLYPPPTILLFTPLGFMSYDTALLTWTIFNLFFLIGCIYQVYDLFLRQYKLNGLILAATLFFLFLPVRETVSFSQTNFILLFLLLLMYKYSDKKFAGILLALALFTKPYMIIFAVFFVLRGKWKTMLYFITSSLALGGITALCFGKGPFLSYIFDNPSKRLPDWVFSEENNQSLHGLLLRNNLVTIDDHFSYTCILIAGLLLSGVFLGYLLKRKLYDYLWATLLLVGLLFYPGTLSYYGVLLLFILFQFFNEKSLLGLNINFAIPVICVCFYLGSLSVFASICFLLSIIVFKSVKSVSKQATIPFIFASRL